MKTPVEKWTRVEAILRLLPAAREQMKAGLTAPLRDAGTQHYVELVDELADLMLEMHGAEAFDGLADVLNVTFAGAA